MFVRAAANVCMETALRVGIALYNASEAHAANEAWGAVGLDLRKDDDTDNCNDESLFNGLIQFSGSVYHAQSQNWDDTVGLAESAHEYLEPLPTRCRGIDTNTLAAACRWLAVDPKRVNRESAPAVQYKGRRLTAADLEIEGITMAAGVVADEYNGYDQDIIDAAIDFACEEATDGGSQFIGLLTSFVDDRGHRGIVYDRLRKQVDRRQSRRDDVIGLFE